MTALRPAVELLDDARRILAEQRERLRAAAVPGTLVLLGGSSLPGALTRGDVDLHLRVPPERFADVVAVLRETHAVVHPEIWRPTLATFTVDPGSTRGLPTGLAVTPAGSEHDARFTRSWARLAADPALLAAYNALKLAAVDAPDEEYERRKSAFFDRLAGA